LILLAFLFPLAVYCLILAFVNRSPHPILVPGRWDLAGVLFAASGTLWIAYFTVVLTWAGFFMWRRGRMTAVYNVEPSVFDDVFARVLDRLRLGWTRSARRVVIDVPDDGANGTRTTDDPVSEMDAYREPVSVRPGTAGLVVDVEAFPALRHVSLYWADRGPLRADIEDALDRALLDVQTGYNPVGTWLLAVSAALFSATFFGMVLFLLSLLIRVR
jgi:hypothetical protein